MATLVLSAAGMLVGGPFGGAIGAMLGGAIDRSVLGPRHEGPRLKDLKVSGSSYGEPIAQHFGKVRAPGVIVWSTDLKEHSEKNGGKGKPKTVTYSYSISLAVLLSSAPIDRVLRIWADGNLLRGAAGDLKTQGRLRIHTGRAHQQLDPLLAAALGAQCPAFRGCAYAVFEDLALADFGNRIPALSFEIEAGSGADTYRTLVGAAGASSTVTCDGLQGFSYEGGTIGQNAAALGQLYPQVSRIDAAGEISLVAPETAPVRTLTPAASWEDGDFARSEGISKSMAGRSPGQAPCMLRYYDASRDYQPGLQRVTGEDARSNATTIELPVVLTAPTAKRLLSAAHSKAVRRRETMAWRTPVLNPMLLPGSLVRAPGVDGLWRVVSWEWRSGGVELALERHIPAPVSTRPADAGTGWRPRDRQPQPTVLRAFELPWSGFGPSTERQVYIAASAGAGLWSGGVLYAEKGAALAPLLDLPRQRATLGHLIERLPGSTGLRLEQDATLKVRLLDPEALLSPANAEDLAVGANRARVGREILQFALAEPLGGGDWLLRGLLRGRGGSELLARQGWQEGTPFTLLDEALVAIPAEAAAGLGASQKVAALGFGDAEPVEAAVEAYNTSLRPLSPVHPRRMQQADGSVTLSWTRRARGAWDWTEETDAPLVEEKELYQLGLGPIAKPFLNLLLTAPSHVFTAAQWSELSGHGPGTSLWVRQCGRFARSEALELHKF